MANRGVAKKNTPKINPMSHLKKEVPATATTTLQNLFLQQVRGTSSFLVFFFFFFLFPFQEESTSSKWGYDDLLRWPMGRNKTSFFLHCSSSLFLGGIASAKPFLSLSPPPLSSLYSQDHFGTNGQWLVGDCNMRYKHSSAPSQAWISTHIYIYFFLVFNIKKSLFFMTIPFRSRGKKPIKCGKYDDEAENVRGPPLTTIRGVGGKEERKRRTFIFALDPLPPPPPSSPPPSFLGAEGRKGGGRGKGGIEPT